MELVLAPAPLMLRDITKPIQHASTRSLLCAACGLLRELMDCPMGVIGAGFLRRIPRLALTHCFL